MSPQDEPYHNCRILNETKQNKLSPSPHWGEGLKVRLAGRVYSGGISAKMEERSTPVTRARLW